MKTRICPLCDQTMKKKHYCDSCNSFVWKPVYLDIHYNLWGDSALDCAYDAMPHKYDYHDDGSVTMTPSKRQDQKESRKFRGGQEFGLPNRPASRDSKKAAADMPRKKGGCLKKFILICFILSMFSTVFSMITNMVMDMGEDILMVPEPDMDIWDDTDSEVIEFTEDEVFEMGEECTGCLHLNMICDEFIPVFEDELEALNSKQISNYSETSYNWGYDYGTEIVTYFTTSRTYDLDLGDGYYAIEWDTYSRRIHDLDFDVFGREYAESYFDVTMNALGYDDEALRIEFQKQLSVAEDTDYVFYNTEGLEIYISCFDDENSEELTYYVSITNSFEE